jgi:hypothetical protein
MRVLPRLDLATPPQIATEQLLPYLPKGREVVLAGFGHLPTFWHEQPEASSRLINTFFATGEVDASRFKPVIVGFTPEVTNTLMAKRIAGAGIGIALVAVLSLVWLSLRVHRRGGFGRKTSALLRSLYAVVLGVGGWFAGALIVMTTLPGVPVDDQLVVVVSMGLPIGLGIYWAWVDRERSAQTRTVGLVAALGGALAGAWLGFGSTAGLPAFITALVGAIIGANLLLIVLDVARARSRPRPLARSLHLGAVG